MNYITHSATTKSYYHEKTEDNHAIGDNYIVIADGMGGECNGDTASEIAVKEIAYTLKRNLTEELSEIETKELMFEAIYAADKAILHFIRNNPDCYGMGTTVLLLIYNSKNLYLAWCGDSRCFVYSDGQIRSLTKDHSYVQELVDKKEITEEEAFTHQDNNIITRYVGGGDETCRPEFISGTWHAEDIIILCSDGLSGYCREKDICKKVSSNINIADLPEELLDLAIKHGSDDDITIITLSRQTGTKPTGYNSIIKWFKQKISS